MVKLGALLVICVAACGSKAKDKPGGDVTITSQGDDAIVSDEVAGYEIHLPRDPSVKDYKSGEPGGMRPGRAVTGKLSDGSAVGIHIVRLTRDDYDPKKMRQHYDYMIDNMRAAGMEVSDVHDVTRGGLSGVELRFADGKFSAHEWTAIDPDHDTSYVIMWSPGDKPEPTLDAYVKTFRRAS